MGPEIKIWIDRAEATWLDVLYDNAKTVFQDNTLPSHDHTHHMRVWNLCKTLLREIATFNSRMDHALVDGVLISAFFHDLGMASSTREDHGRLSRESCEKWFRDTGREVPERYEEILRAIELHDRKEEQIYKSFQPEATPEILGILSVADDLEALGTIGIFRYAEIYLMRGVPLEELGSRILENAKTRFEKLVTACQLCHSLIEACWKQYDELCNFYVQYESQLREVSRADTVSSGPLGVINYIRRQGMDKTKLHRAGSDVSEYYKKLENELEQARL